MQDRYLFRGKRKHNGEWVEGFLYIYQRDDTRKEEWCILQDISTLTSDFKINYVDPDTVGQCTGRKDDSEKPYNIFDGDILVGRWRELLDYGNVDLCEDVGAVSWNDVWGKWIVTDSTGTHDLYDWCEDVLVITNIYDEEGKDE